MTADATFRLLVASVVDYAIYLLDAEGRVASWNAGAERIKGYRADEILGQHFSRFFPEDDAAAGRPAELLDLARREGRCEREGWRVRKDGTRFWANAVLTALRDERDEVVGFAKVTRDLTERRRAEEQRLDLASMAVRALGLLGDVALALADARTTEQVAAVVVDRGRALAQADTCFLYLLDEAGQALDLVAHRGVATEIVEQAVRLTAATAPQTFAHMLSGRSAWAESAEEYARMFPGLSQMRASGPRARAFWSMPLLVAGAPVGLFGMGFYEERRFAPQDRAVAETLARQCAEALLRAQRLEREERTRAWVATTLRSIGDAVVATDREGRVTFLNPVAERLTGWPDNDARGRPLQEVFSIFSEQTREPVENPVARVLREGQIVGLANHTVLRSRHGKEIPIDDSAAPIRDAEGHLFGVVLVFRDASAEKRELVHRDFLARAGAALAASLDYHATLATVAQLAVPQLADWCTVHIVEPGTRAPQQVAAAHVDPGKARFVTELARKYPTDPDAKYLVPNVIRTSKAELYPELPASVLDARALDEEHRQIIRELGMESAMVVPLVGHARTLGAIAFLYAGSGRRYGEDDLTFAEEFARRAAMAIENAWALREAERARAEEAALRREADIASRAKDEFLATVSHELRTPLSAIVGWTLRARARQPPPELDRALAIIERNARRQARLIEDVLDVSRIISGKLSLTMAPTNVGEVVDAAIEAVTEATEAKGVTIETAVDDLLMITADSGRLQQIVLNLLANAVKFSPKGAAVSIRAQREGSDACIVVEDRGEGIAPDVLPLIFEPFRQADASTTRRHGGLGLGLAIVKQLVTAHGGTVEARSDGLGLGAEFVVRLPVRAEVPVVTERRSSAPPTAQSVPKPSAIPRLDGLVVLVVDDEEDAREIAEQLLRDAGATVVAAASANEALEKFAMRVPDVLVSDVGMPDMDGYALLRKVRALPAEKGGRTPALALTAYAADEDAERAFAAGFQRHAAKPIEPTQLVTLVASLGGRPLRDG